MRNQFHFVLSAAIATSTLLWAVPSSAQTMTNASSEPSPAAQVEATKMVAAEAVLLQTIDKKKVEPGQQFSVQLSKTVDLKNGTVLPKGTKLIGAVSAKGPEAGDATLALRFTKADLGDGKTIPIVATITGAAPPNPDDYYSNLSGDERTLNIWDGQALRTDEVGALSGIDLHSNIAGVNSGVFISAKKHDVRLTSGSQFALAISAQG